MTTNDNFILNIDLWIDRLTHNEGQLLTPEELAFILQAEATAVDRQSEALPHVVTLLGATPSASD